MDQPEPNAVGKRMTIAEHLDELRKRLVRASAALAIVFALSWFWVDDLMLLLERPHIRAMEALQRSQDRRLALGLLDQAIEAEKAAEAPKETLSTARSLIETGEGIAIAEQLPTEALRAQFQAQREKIDARLLSTSYTAPIITYMKACFIIALLLAGPYVLWEIWGFIAAGLYKREKTFMRRYFPLALALFFSGVFFGYFLMIPVSLEFLAQVGSTSIKFQPTIDEYFGLFSTLTFILGLVFQIPLVMLILSRLGVLEPSAFRGKWKIVIVVCFIVSAIATPTPDPINQTILALAIYLLYELGILLAKFGYRERQKQIEGNAS